MKRVTVFGNCHMTCNVSLMTKEENTKKVGEGIKPGSKESGSDGEETCMAERILGSRNVNC